MEMNYQSLLRVVCFCVLLGCSTKKDYQKEPKVELHLHLDCSLSYEVVKKIDSSISVQTYKDTFIAPPKCTDLGDYIKRAIKGVELMQTRENLRLVTLDLFKQLKADNVIYAEIRFAPLLHTLKGLTPDEVVQTVNDAVEEGTKTFDVDAGIILCTLRHYTEEQSMQTVELAKKYQGSKVVGFDIAADEARFPIDNHVKAFQFAISNGIKCTAHAGEAKGSESVRETLAIFKPLRIGHGVRSAEDSALLTILRENGIHLEVCPTSNVQTNVFDKITDHTASKIFNSGVSMSINTDARTISNVTLTHEYELMEHIFGWNKQHFQKCNLEAINHSFATDEVKSRVRRKIEEAYR